MNKKAWSDRLNCARRNGETSNDTCGNSGKPYFVTPRDDGKAGANLLGKMDLKVALSIPALIVLGDNSNAAERSER